MIYIAVLVFIEIYLTVTICNQFFQSYDRKGDQKSIIVNIESCGDSDNYICYYM